MDGLVRGKGGLAKIGGDEMEVVVKVGGMRERNINFVCMVCK